MKNSFHKLPRRIPEIPFDKNEEEIILYRGQCILKQQNKESNQDVVVSLKWFPSEEPTISILCAPSVFKLGSAECRFLITSFDVNIVSQRVILGKGSDIKCYPKNGNIILGKRDNAKEFYMYLFNYRNYIGRVVRENCHSWSRSRLVLLGKDHKICLDNVVNINDFLNDLKHRGGYRITHNCMVKRISSARTYSIERIIFGLQFFFALVNGAWCGPIIIHQRSRTRSYLWCRRTFAEPFHSHHSVISFHTPDVLFSLYRNFDLLYRQKYWRPVIEKLIHIYVSCNTASHITVEMATILSLTALEILANVIIVENESMYDAKKYDRYSASRRISILLRHWKIPQDIPNDLPKLRCRAKRGGTNSGPEIVCQLRNSVVHPHEKNRKRLFSFSTEQRIECWILTMHYLELCLLRLLGYNQVYVPRIKRNIYAGYTEQVPWN